MVKKGKRNKVVNGAKHYFSVFLFWGGGLKKQAMKVMKRLDLQCLKDLFFGEMIQNLF